MVTPEARITRGMEKNCHDDDAAGARQHGRRQRESDELTHAGCYGKQERAAMDVLGLSEPDNGTDFHDYAVLEKRFPVKSYFATPYHSWERGSNENFNGAAAAVLAERHLREARHTGFTSMRLPRRGSQQSTVKASWV